MSRNCTRQASRMNSIMQKIVRQEYCLCRCCEAEASVVFDDGLAIRGKSGPG